VAFGGVVRFPVAAPKREGLSGSGLPHSISSFFLRQMTVVRQFRSCTTESEGIPYTPLCPFPTMNACN